MKQAVSLPGTVFALLVLLLSTSAYTHLRSRMAVPQLTAVNLEQLPLELGAWKGVEGAGLTQLARDILKLDHAVRRTYRGSDGSFIDLYIGYWKRQSGEHQAAKHSPAVCLPSNGWNTWGQSTKELAVGGAPGDGMLKLNSIAGQFAQENHLFYYWFFSGERTYANEWTALFFITLEKFWRNRSDGGIVEISTPVGGPHGEADNFARAQERLESFARELHPALMKLLTENVSPADPHAP